MSCANVNTYYEEIYDDDSTKYEDFTTTNCYYIYHDVVSKLCCLLKIYADDKESDAALFAINFLDTKQQ